MTGDKRFSKCSQNMAWYLFRKWEAGNISQATIERLFTEEACTYDIFGGWFVDFHYGL